jgi:hypothetical protein
MSDTWFAILLAIFLLFFAGICAVLLVWPSKFLRHIQNPWQPDTPLNRVHTRALGVFACLFLLLMTSGSTKTLEGFHRNILVALWASPVILPVFLWVLWQYSPLKHVNRRYLAGEAEEPQWELRMSVAFCSLLSTIVVAAFLLAMGSVYPK